MSIADALPRDQLRLTFVLAPNNTVGALDPKDVRTPTLAEFKHALEQKRASEHRGPAGTKADESPHKDGWSFIPAEIDFASPLCACLPSDKKRDQVPFHARYADHPALRHRAKHSVRRMSPMVVLELDDHSREQVNAILDRLEADGLDFSAWSTHSYGRADRPNDCPARIVVYCSTGYAPEYAGAVRRGLAARYGIAIDKQANTPITLFYVPSCPNDPRRIAMAWLRHSCAVGLLDPMSVVSEGEKRTQARRAGAAAKSREEFAAVGKASEAHCGEAERLLEAFAKLIEAHRDQHVRQLLRGAFYYGQFAGAGALEARRAEERLLRAVAARREAIGEDPGQHAMREAVVVDQLARGFADPRLPDVDEEAGALERLQTMLDEGVGRTEIQPAQAPQAVRDALRSRTGNELLVVQVTPGARKTGTALEEIRNAAEHQGQASLMLAPRHNLITELMQRVGIPSRRHRSPAAADIEGEPNCNPAMKPAAVQAARLGLNIRENVCKRCPLHKRCELFRREQSDAIVHFGAHQLPTKAVTAHHDAVHVYVDEMPELVEASPFASVEEASSALALPLDMTFIAETAAYPLPVLHELYRTAGTPDELTLMAAKSADVKLRGDVEAAIAFEHADTVRTLRVLRAIRLWAQGAAIGEPVVWNELALHLRREGGVILTATPDLSRLQKLGAQLRVVRIDVADAHPTTRIVLLRSEASRRFVEPDKKVDEAVVARVWADAANRAAAAGVRKLVVMSYMRTVTFLQTLPLDSRFEQVSFAYYGNLTGLNTWADFDGFVTLFDPWPPGDSIDEQAQAARAELCQAHGRARDPNRATPAWHLHVGQLAPLGWHSDNTLIERTKRGAPTGKPQQQDHSKRRSRFAGTLREKELTLEQMFTRPNYTLPGDSGQNAA